MYIHEEFDVKIIILRRSKPLGQEYKAVLDYL